jgi:uncharacterized protein (DUF427 family)
MIKCGVALLRLSNSSSGCGGKGLTLEEFYVVVADGDILPTRFWSYAAAYKHLEKLMAKNYVA